MTTGKLYTGTFINVGGQAQAGWVRFSWGFVCRRGRRKKGPAGPWYVYGCCLRVKDDSGKSTISVREVFSNLSGAQRGLQRG